MYKLTVKFSVKFAEVSNFSDLCNDFTFVKYQDNVLTLSKFGNYALLADIVASINTVQPVLVSITKDN